MMAMMTGWSRANVKFCSEDGWGIRSFIGLVVPEAEKQGQSAYRPVRLGYEKRLKNLHQAEITTLGSETVTASATAER
jgi:hypothetical protein